MRSKNLNSPNILGEKLLKAKFGVRITGYVTFFSLTGGEVTGRCSRSLLFVVFSLKLLPSTWMRALVPTEELNLKWWKEHPIQINLDGEWLNVTDVKILDPRAQEVNIQSDGTLQLANGETVQLSLKLKSEGSLDVQL